MSQFTAKELYEEINDAYPENDFFLDAYYEEVAELETRYGEVIVEQVDGGEGDGAGIEVVISVQDRYFEINGEYSSWDSSSFDGDLYEVKPKQVQVTQYERI